MNAVTFELGQIKLVRVDSSIKRISVDRSLLESEWKLRRGFLIIQLYVIKSIAFTAAS